MGAPFRRVSCTSSAGVMVSGATPAFVSRSVCEVSQFWQKWQW